MNCRYKDIEKFFGMSFSSVVTELHLKGNRSIHSLVKESGISHTSFINLAKKLGIKLRSHKQSSSLNMKLNNAIKSRGAANKRARTIRNTFSNNLWPQERLFKKILDNRNVVYEMQRPEGPYNIDFFIPSLNLCIEIDSTFKWGNSKRLAAKKKDVLLLNRGYKILRIDKRKLSDLAYINDILKTYNVI